MITDLPSTKTESGHERRVGVEIEMNGVPLPQLAQLIADELGLTLATNGRYQYCLSGDKAGDWLVEVDFRLLKEMGQQQYQAGEWGDEVKQRLEAVLHRLSEPFVPLELVSPPLPLSRLGDIERLSQRLHHAGAKGSSDQLLNAFGLQFNPELPALDADTIRHYLQAFVCLGEWLKQRHQTDLARRVTPFIDPFSNDYIRHLLAPGYQPDLATLIDDYLRWNPTRNRPLDMLPLFTEVDAQRVRAVTDDPLIKARPTLHYRLPDCEIHRSDWSPARVWNDWCQVEFLAFDKPRLSACSAALYRHLGHPLERWLTDWVTEVEAQWLLPSLR